jgi:ABC-2 type transport system permease protein
MVSAVVRKELRDLFRNRTLLVSLLAPVILAVLFVRIVERSQSAPLVRIAMPAGADEQVRTVLTMSLAFQVLDADSAEDARKRVEDGTADAALLLPGDFDARLRRPTPAPVQLVVRRDASPRTAAAISALREILRLRAGQPSPVALSLEQVGRDESLVLRGRMLVGFVVFVLLMGFGLVATSLVEERERGTMAAIRVTGARPGAVLLGKALTVWGLCLAATLLMVGVCGLLRAPYDGLVAVTASGAGFAVALGLWMGAVFPNMAAANAGLPVVFLLVFVPAFLEEHLQWTWAGWLPGHFLVTGLQRTLVEAGGVGTVWVSSAVLAAYAAVCAGAAWMAVRTA